MTFGAHGEQVRLSEAQRVAGPPQRHEVMHEQAGRIGAALFFAGLADWVAFQLPQACIVPIVVISSARSGASAVIVPLGRLAPMVTTRTAPDGVLWASWGAALPGRSLGHRAEASGVAKRGSRRMSLMAFHLGRAIAAARR